MFSEAASMLSRKAGQLWLTMIAMHRDEEDGNIDEACLLYWNTRKALYYEAEAWILDFSSIILWPPGAYLTFLNLKYKKMEKYYFNFLKAAHWTRNLETTYSSKIHDSKCLWRTLLIQLSSNQPRDIQLAFYLHVVSLSESDCFHNWIQ